VRLSKCTILLRMWQYPLRGGILSTLSGHDPVSKTIVHFDRCDITLYCRRRNRESQKFSTRRNEGINTGHIMQSSREIRFHHCVFVQSYSRLTPVRSSHHPRSKISPTRSLRQLALPEAEQGFLAPVGFGLGEPRRGGRARWRQTCPYLSTRRAPGALARERDVVVDGRGTSLVNNVHALLQALLDACLNGPLAVNREASRGLGAGFLSGMSLSSMAYTGRHSQSASLNRGFIVAYLPWRAAHARSRAKVRRSRRRRILCVLLRLRTPPCTRTSTYTHKTRLRPAGPPALRARCRS
jgi:hypothetical protein